MTTIAYANGELAGDSAIYDQGHDYRCGQMAKIFKLQTKGGQPFWLGAAGACGEIIDAKEHIDGHIRDFFDPRLASLQLEKVDILLISASGEMMTWNGRNRPVSFVAPFWACGSGRSFALGALAQGATAREAVEIACRFDAGSGGTVKVLSLHGIGKPQSGTLPLQAHAR